MALVDIPGRASLEVPDNWGRDEVTDFVRQSYPDLFEPASVDAGPSAVTLGPDRAPLSPAERQARISSIRGTPAENRQFDREQSRIADLDALEAARESGGLSGFLGSSDIMVGPRRVAAGAANFLRVPGTVANIQLAPLFMSDATRPAAERIAQLLSDMDRGITGAQEQLRASERPDAEPSLVDVYRSGRDIGPLAAAADLGTLGVNAIADSAAYIIPGGAVAKALQGAGIGAKAAGILGPMISVAPVETADALSEYLDAGANPVAARIAAPIVGFINGALESITDSKLLARLGGGDAAKKGAAKFLVGQILGEGLTEGLQEGATVAGRAALTGDPGPDVANRIGSSVVGGMFGGAGLGGAVELVNRAMAPAPLEARGVPVEVARAELAPGEVPTGSVPIASGPVEGALGAARDYAPPLGRRKRKAALNFARIAEEEGVSDLVDFIPEAKMMPDGKTAIEGEFEGGRFRVYIPNIRNESRLRGALREEKAHGWIASEPGQVALTDFVDRHPLTDTEWTKLQNYGYLQQEGEDVAGYVRRLGDEFVAKLNRDPKWKQWVGEAVAWVKEKIGVSLTNAQAGRLMLRNLRRTGGQSEGQSRQSLRSREIVDVDPRTLVGEPKEKQLAFVDALRKVWGKSGEYGGVSKRWVAANSEIEALVPLLGEYGLKTTDPYTPPGLPEGSGTSAVPLKELRERLVAAIKADNRQIAFSETPRFSLAPDRLPKIVDSIRTEFPSAPPIVEGPPDPRGAYYDGQNIGVSASDLSGNPASARSAIVSALVESGLDVFGPTFVADTYAMLRETDPVGTARIAERLAANPKTPEGQRAILGEVLRLQGQESRLRPWVRKWMRRLRLSPTDELSRNLERLARTTLATYEIPENLAGGRATPAAQVYADLNHAVWTFAKPIVDRLRNLAIDERFAVEDEKAFRNMGNRMRALGDSGRARDIGAGVERPWNPRSETYIDDLRAADVPTTDADERLHAAYRLEAEARDLVRTLDAIDDLTELLAQLERSAPNFDRTEDLARLAALRAEIAAADPGALARAGDLRLHAARKWESRAAQMVMLDPQIQAWLEIVERIEQSGATPREASGNLADAAEVARDTLFLSWRPFQKRTAQVYDDFMSTTYPERLRALRTRLEGLTGDRVRAHVAVGEILAALRGVMGLSGSTEDRATAEFLLENDEQLRRFIVALAQADPDSAVARFRDQFLQRPDTAPVYTEAQAQLDAELGVSTFQEVPRYEVSGISTDDVRALFGTESRTANPDLYEWFAKQPSQVKKEVVKNALRGVVDDRLAKVGGRRQVGVDRVEIPGRAPTPAELQARFNELLRADMEARGLEELQAAAEASGISIGALTRLVDLIRESDGRRNAVVEAYGAVDRSITESALAAIRSIEFATGSFASQTVGVGPVNTRAAAIIAAPAIARFVRARGRAIDALTGVEQDIAQLEGRRVALEMLRDAGATEIPTPETGATRMIYDANDGGVLFREFVRADGSEQPAIRLLPGQEYTGDLLVQLVDWQCNAEEAVAAGSNQEPVTRGLRVAVSMMDFYIDAKFTRDQISSTIAPTRGMDRTGGSPFTLWLNIGTRETLSKLVSGVQGRRLKAKLAGYVKAGQVIDKLTRKHVRKNRELMIAAAESLGLDLRNEGDPVLLQRARNEVSHRVGRQFSSGLGVGDRLISLPGRTITPELLNLLRNDRAVGREAQAEELRRPYGGVRIQIPGSQIVRRPGETGDFGLARLPRPAIYQRLAEVYRTKDPLQIAAFWDSAESQQGLLWHILDSGRADLGVERDGDLTAAEQRIANRIFQGAAVPKTLDEAISLLTAESGLTRAEVRSKLLKELEGYARIAAARVPAESGTSAKTSAIEAFGESDLTEFTQSAAPLMFPSSWYTYGMSDSLQAFLERTGDAAQVEFLTALQESAKELRTIAAAIAEAQTLPEGEKAAVFAKYRGDILWHTNSDWSGTNIDKVRAQAAVKNMKLRADRLAAEIASIQAPSKAWHSSVQRGISNVIPYLLMWTGPAVANIVSGPWAGRFVNRPFLGTGVSTARAIADMLVGSPMHFAYDRLMVLGQGLGLKLSEPEELQAYLEGAGILGSYSRAELGESEAWSRGEVTGGLGTRISQAGQEAANAISERVGVRLGDSVLNRYIARTMVPPIIWRMKRIAAVWKSRLAREGLTYDPANPLTLLSDADVGGSATLRDFLGTFGNPEAVLQSIESVPVRTFWRSELGATIGSSILAQVNAATRGNRPTSNPLLSLLGWTANMVNQIAADSRTVPDDSRLKKVSQTTLRALSWMALAAISAYWSTIARRSAQAGQTQLAEAIQQILMGLDDDDDEGLLDALTRLSGLIREHIPGAPLVFNAAARVAGAMKTPPPTGEPTPLDMSFWGQSPTEILKDIAFTVPKGVGLDLENPRLPAVGILSTVGQGLAQVGQAGWTIAHDLGPEGQAGAKADLKEGTRKVLSVFSMAGQFVYNMANPEAVVSKQVKSEIVEAARKIGLEPSKPPKFGSWLAPTPKEQALREAARRGDEEGMRNIAGFAFRQAYNKAVEKGESPEQAQSAGEQAVKGLLVALDPIRDAIGGPISEEQYRKLQPLLGPKVREAMNQRARAVQVISERPPEGMRSFAPTPAMETPVKRTPGGRVSSSRGRGRRGRRPSFLARRRSAGRRVRRVRLRV